MFKGFKLSGISFSEDFDKYYNIGLNLYEQYNDYVRESLDEYFLDNKSLDGTEIIESWFPQVDSHIFISHSHNDENTVIALAGWLKSTFNLDSFIDSCIWGYGNDLIQMLDNEYSWLNRQNRLYDYNKVLFSTSHVHMMLSTALSSMIDKTECLIFYDTPNSIKPFNSISRTESPWIYSEIAFSEIVRITEPERLKQLIVESREYSSFDGVQALEKSLKIKYKVNDKHLKQIDNKTLNEWSKYSRLFKKEKALDKLYELTYPIDISNG